jgi:acetyl esterase
MDKEQDAALPLDALEPETRAFIQTLIAQGGPPLQTLPVEEARNVLNALQSGPADKPAAQIEDRRIPNGPSSAVSVRIVRPEKSVGTLPVVLFLPGGGWILGNKETHDRLIRVIANQIPAAVVFVNYTPAPEARFPAALEQAYSILQWIAEEGGWHSLDSHRLAVVGDSAGGCLAAALTLLTKQRGGAKIHFQVLLYPVTDGEQHTASTRLFAEGPWLTASLMRWFWDAYAPDATERTSPLASPLRASLDELSGLPPALIITAENDVLRDEGEAYARKLREAGVPVTAIRYLGTIHDFMMLNAIAKTPAARAAVTQMTTMLRQVFSQE